MIRKIMILTAMGGVLLSGNAQTSKKLTAEKSNEYGLVYCLPLTALQVDVKTKRTVQQAGPYFQYAKKYIGADNVIKEDSESWTITDVTVTPYGVPDPEQQYLMQLKPGALTYVCVTPDGMLLSINEEEEYETPKPVRNTQPVSRPYSGKEYLQYMNEDFLASQSSAKQAQMLAENLMEVRDAKISLTRGTAESMPTDGRQLELMLNSLADQEATMTAAFIGRTMEDEFQQSFTFTPGEPGKNVLFRLSDFAGFVDADDLRGEPVYITVDVTRRGELPKDVNGEEKKLPKDAVVYAIPGAAKVTLTWKGKTIFSKEFDFAQYGTTFGLAPNLFTDKKAPSFAIFDPNTGALIELGKQ